MRTLFALLILCQSIHAQVMTITGVTITGVQVSGPTNAAAPPAADTSYITATPSYDGSFTPALTNGIWIHMTNTVTVTSLGRFVRSGDSRTLRVVMRDSSCTLLASAMVPGTGTVGTSNIVTITSVTATAGNDYCFMVEFDGGGDHWSNNGMTYTHTSAAGPGKTGSAAGAAIADGGGACDAAAGQGYTPVTFLYH